MVRFRPHVRLVSVMLLAGAVLSPPPESATASPRPHRLPTPVLIERDVARGAIDRARGDLYLAYALAEPERLPRAYRSSVPWEGTSWLLSLRDRLERMPPSPARAALREALTPIDTCGGFTGGTSTDTAHFHIHYTGPTDPPIEAYKASLETAWATEVDAFGWAAPPLVPGPQYLVVVAPLGPVFGFVSSTGTVGDNPNTPWNDQDAQTSCMVLSNDYSLFPPSSPQQALDATTAHEFNHSIQFGYGALDGPNEPDPAFVEGGATWMEDEVFDGSNDNYRYLWPDFADDMGQYKDANLTDPYEYWITWRGLTEPYGTGNSGGGERVMQRFWELTSKNEADTLDALDQALLPESTTLAAAYHTYAVAVKFNRPCGGGYTHPYCLEEGPDYVAARGPTPAHGSIGGIGESFGGSLPDNYSLNWVTLPTGAGTFQLRLKNTSNGGKLRATVACDTGSQLRLKDFSGLAGPSETVWVKKFDPAGCGSLVAVVTNIAQTAPNPSGSANREYQLSVTPPPKPSKTTLKVRVHGDSITARGRLRPPHPGKRMKVTLFKRDGGGFHHVDTDRPRLKGGKRYKTTFGRPLAERCKVTARFKGDIDHLASKKTKSFPC